MPKDNGYKPAAPLQEEELPMFLGEDYIADVLPHVLCLCIGLSESGSQPDPAQVPDEWFVDEAELWKRKRRTQLQDHQALQTGAVTDEDLSWFSGGRARRCKLPGSPY